MDQLKVGNIVFGLSINNTPITKHTIKRADRDYAYSDDIVFYRYFNASLCPRNIKNVNDKVFSWCIATTDEAKQMMLNKLKLSKIRAYLNCGVNWRKVDDATLLKVYDLVHNDK